MIVLYGLEPNPAWHEIPGFRVVHAGTLEELTHCLHVNPLGVHVVLIGADVTDPARTVQRVHAIDRGVSVLLVGEPEQQATVMDALRFTPFIGTDVQWAPGTAPEVVREAALAAASRVKSQRRHQLTVARANTALGLSSAVPAEPYLDHLLDQVPVGVLVTDAAGVVHRWNTEAKRILGTGARPLAGTRLSDAFDRDRDRFERHLAEASGGDRVAVTDQFERRGPDGRLQVVRVKYARARSPSEDSLMIVLEDVTDLEVARERIGRLQRVTARLSGALTPSEVVRVILDEALPALDAAAGGVTLLDDSGTHLELLGQVGYGADTVARFSRIPLDARLPITDAIRTREAHYLSGTEIAARYPLLAGQRGNNQSAAGLPLLAGERVLGVLVLSFTDDRVFSAEERSFMSSLAEQCAQALERARLYQTSRLSEQRYRSLVDATRQVVWTTCPDGRMLGEQPDWARLTGQSREAYEHGGWADRVHPDDRDATLRAWQRALQSRSAYDVEHRVQVADGTYRYFHGHGVPVLNEDGSIREWVGVHTDVTERVLAETQLRLSEERLRHLVQASPVGIAIGDLNGALRLPNDAYLNMLGYTREEYESGVLNWAERTPREYRDADERAFRQAFASGVSEPYEKEMLRRDGTRFPAGMLLARYEQHDETFVVGYVQDLTVHKAAERALRQYGEELERQVRERTAELEEQRAALDAFVRFTELAATSNEVPELTRHAAEVLNATLGDVSVAYYEPQDGRWKAVAWSEDIPADTVAMLRAGIPADQPQFARAVQGREAHYMEEWDAQREELHDSRMYGAGALYPFYSDAQPVGLLNMASMRTRHWSARQKAIFRAVGRSYALALEHREQTRRLESQRAELDARTRVLEAFAEFTRDLDLDDDTYHVIRAAQDVLVSMLPGAASVYWVPDGDVWRNRAQAGVVPPEAQVPPDAGTNEGHAQEFVKAWAAHEPLFVDAVDAGTKEGGLAQAGASAAAYLPLLVGTDPQGVLTVTLWRTSSGWSRPDRALVLALKHALELVLEGVQSAQALRERTRELERSNAELEQFAYVASHDLQAPLRAVTSFTQLLARRLDGQLDERSQSMMQHILSGSQRMKILIDDLLSFSRASRMQQEFGAVRVEDVLGQALLNLRSELDETQATVTQDTLPVVLGNAPALVQVFQNLIGNALKYRRPGVAPQVHVSAEHDGSCWRISVRDNGIGIPEPFYEKIFLVFQRLHRQDEIEGTGIGLAICKRIVERHEGRLWVESVPGQGSTFHFTVPEA